MTKKRPAPALQPRVGSERGQVQRRVNSPTIGANLAGPTAGNQTMTRLLRQAKPAPPVPNLTGFDLAVGGFEVNDLNEALVTVYGELSAVLHPRIDDEAVAIASTIFNRFTNIVTTRNEVKREQDAKNEVEAKYLKIGREKHLVGKEKTKYTRELGGPDKYAARVDELKAQHAGAEQELKQAGGKLQQAKDRRHDAEAYAGLDGKSHAPVTLTTIVTAPGQYIGHATGVADRRKFPTLLKIYQGQHAKRWETAKAAVRAVAASASAREAFIEMRSNMDGKRKLESGQERIGGNDFSDAPM